LIGLSRPLRDIATGRGEPLGEQPDRSRAFVHEIPILKHGKYPNHAQSGWAQDSARG
jgi:hypothetical protein